MKRVVLLTVEKTFCLGGDRHPQRSVLIVEPRLPVPAGGWKGRTETVVVRRPDGSELEATAHISMSHLNLSDPEATSEQRWCVTLLFHGMTGDDVPDGSKILVSQETRDALLPDIPASPPRTMRARSESHHPLHQAVVEGDIDHVSRYLAEGGSANVLDLYDCEPLLTAVKYDQLEIAELLLAAGGDISRRSKLRGTPFGTACWNWHLRMMDFCVRAGVDVNAIHNGETVLDEMEHQSAPLDAELLLQWQAVHDKLVAWGARHAADL